MRAQLDAARAFIAASLDEQARVRARRRSRGGARRASSTCPTSSALAGVDWVQENLPETLEVKREVFALLDRHAPPEAVLASSTSAIPASQFTEALAGRARCLVAHPVNPPHLVPVVELCGAPWTAPDVDRAREARLRRRRDRCRSSCARELDGFILNRLQGALLSEAMRLVGEGYVSPEDLDKTVRDGLGLRWSFMGPFATIELNAPGGVADYCARYGGVLSPARRRRRRRRRVWDAGNAGARRGRARAAAACGRARRAHPLARPPADGAWPRTSGINPNVE